jgi:hypothetical protein
LAIGLRAWIDATYMPFLFVFLVRGADDAPPRRPGRRRGLRRREDSLRVPLRHRHAYRRDPPSLTE